MTGIIDAPEDETAIFRRIIREYVMNSSDVEGTVLDQASLRRVLVDRLARIRKQPLPLRHALEPRLVPSVERKEKHHGFHPDL
jgi:hypothetical protein